MMTQETKPMFEITGVLVPDMETKGFTAYFAEFPEVIAQGANQDEAKRNLIEALQFMLDFKREENDQEDCDGDVITQSYQFSLG